MAEWQQYVKAWLDSFSADQMVEILLEESSLTRRQFAALLIDISGEDLAQKSIGYANKARMMPRGVTRGAYNRILMQARRNVVKSFFTLYLLGYVGLLDLAQLNTYIQLGNEIRDYIDAYRKAEKEGVEERGEKVFRVIHKELLEKTSRLAKPASLKPLGKL